MTNELDPDGRRLFLELSADLYEQAMQDIRGEGPRNEGLAFWQAIREAMDAEAEQHKRRMTIYRMLEDLAVFRMAKVQGMPYDRIGARAGRRSRSWAFQHTMPQDLVDDLIRTYAEAEAEEGKAFINAQTEPANPPANDRSTVIPITAHSKRPAQEAARRSILYRQLRRFLGGAAVVAGPVYVAMKAAAASYTTTVQTALMSNGALTPMPGLDPLSAGGLSGMLSASSTTGAAAQATGPVTTVVGKVMASAVIGVQATAGVSAPAATVFVAAAGSPVVLAVEGAAKPIVAALGLENPDPAEPPAQDLLLAALPTAPPPGEETLVQPELQVPTVYGTETPTTSPSPERGSPTHVATTAPAPATTTTTAPTPTASATRSPAAAPATTQSSMAAPTPTTVTAEPTVATYTTQPATPQPSTATTTGPTASPTDTPSTAGPSQQPTDKPTEQPPTPDPTPTSPAPDPTPTETEPRDPKPTQTAEPEPSRNPESAPPVPAGDSQPQGGSALQAELPQPMAMTVGTGGALLLPAAGWWYGPTS
ncbi:hypothetical protein [Nonomuraea sp. JJY05]|uniref:hypothetical protein n=1 Tax=Nonomuraea sp. JJY05 TaxID=3350255 RepID=UPI00373EC7D6